MKSRAGAAGWHHPSDAGSVTAGHLAALRSRVVGPEWAGGASMSEQTGKPIKLVSWNIAQRRAPWEWLREMDADVALLQEAGPPPRDAGLEANPGAWQTAGDEAQRLWRCAVVKLSARVEVEWIPTVPLTQAGPGALGVSRPGTLAGAVISADGCEPFTALSMYAPWETGPRQPQSWMWADASAHRMISDLSLLIAKRGTRIVAAGDLNILHGYGEHGQAYPGARYATVFDHVLHTPMTALADADVEDVLEWAEDAAWVLRSYRK